MHLHGSAGIKSFFEFCPSFCEKFTLQIGSVLFVGAETVEQLLSGRYENNMAGNVTVLDRELREVRDIDPGDRVVSRAAWADSTHVLAVLAGLDDNRWSLVRYPLDGGALVMRIRLGRW